MALDKSKGTVKVIVILGGAQVPPGLPTNHGFSLDHDSSMRIFLSYGMREAPNQSYGLACRAGTFYLWVGQFIGEVTVVVDDWKAARISLLAINPVAVEKLIHSKVIEKTLR